MSKIYDAAKRATLKDSRSLKVGDIIKAFYADSEEPQLHLVISQWATSNKEGQRYDFDTIPVDGMGLRSRDWNGPRGLNTDKWMRVAHGGDVLQMLLAHAEQQASLFALAVAVNKK